MSYGILDLEQKENIALEKEIGKSTLK